MIILLLEFWNFFFKSIKLDIDPMTFIFSDGEMFQFFQKMSFYLEDPVQSASYKPVVQFKKKMNNTRIHRFIHVYIAVFMGYLYY